MSTDRREQILARLLEVLEAVPDQLGYDVHTTWRNRGEMKGDKRPALVLLDGIETVKTSTPPGRVFMSPSVMTMQPQIFVLLKLRNLPTNVGVGEELNTFRVALITAIASDETLAQLCGSNGQVQLINVDTDLQTGNRMEGQMQMDFSFDYVLEPRGLTPVAADTA
jgi:hypothetical protein